MATQPMLFDRRSDALVSAKLLEQRTTRFWYVVKLSTGQWEVTDSMPYMGEWYTADGIQHGG